MTLFIECPHCRRQSYNTNDINNRYCATCGFHDDIETAGPIAYSIMGDAASLCAPLVSGEADVEGAMAKLRPGKWKVTDPRKYRDGLGTPTPCNCYPISRQHWFLMR